jgi:CelD/BcsL family acetyltransferase involved in cellulose biosynthesis
MTELAVRDVFDPGIEQIWRRLEAAASPSYFLSWGWIESWLASIPREAAPRLVTVIEDDTTIAAGFVGMRRRRRQGLARTVLYFNTTGDELCDDLCIEHNAILRAPGSALTLDALVGLLAERWPAHWDELLVPAIDRVALAELAPLSDYHVRVARDEAAPYVDLDLVRAIDGGYPALLDPAARVQLHRSRRAVGPVSLEIARDEASALALYDELLALPDHRGPAFDHPWYATMHRRLIASRLGHGEIQLARIHAGSRTLGISYGFTYAGRVISYQLGCARSDDPHVKPDFLCHAALIEHAAARGQAVYDLLAHDVVHTRTLATGASRQLWLRIQRPLVRFAIEDHLEGWRHAIAGWRHRPGAPARS